MSLCPGRAPAETSIFIANGHVIRCNPTRSLGAKFQYRNGSALSAPKYIGCRLVIMSYKTTTEISFIWPRDISDATCYLIRVDNVFPPSQHLSPSSAIWALGSPIYSRQHNQRDSNQSAVSAVSNSSNRSNITVESNCTSGGCTAKR